MFPRLIGAVFCLLVLAGGAWGQAEDKAKRIAQVEQQLAQARAQAEAARKELSAQVQELNKQQHDLEYKDPELVKLRAELRQMEQRAMELRREIDLRAGKNPALKDLEARRHALVVKVSELGRNEQQLREELARLKAEPGG